MNSPWTAALVVLITQIIFIYFRTLNVIYVADRRVWASIFTGVVIGASWLIAISIGVGAINAEQWQPLTAHLIGGAFGTWWAMRHKSVRK